MSRVKELVQLYEHESGEARGHNAWRRSSDREFEENSLSDHSSEFDIHRDRSDKARDARDAVLRKALHKNSNINPKASGPRARDASLSDDGGDVAVHDLRSFGSDSE